MDDYKFELLNETVTNVDLFEDKTHDKIADSLSKLISNEEKGITIGLEGCWGSGKSSIVSMTIDKIKKSGLKALTFQFDAWAHEGDHLRKIFLESFINEIINQLDNVTGEKVKKCLNKKKKIINNQVITKTIIRKQSITKKGIFFTLSAILVPFGAALLSNIDLSNIWFGNPLKGSFYPELFLSIITSLAPLIVACINILYIFFKKKEHNNIFSAENWAFLQKDDSETIEQEFSEMDERTSIEFERYFFEILDVIFNNSNNKKLLIVIDNLDRIDSDIALNIWSTLQIFLQERSEFDTTKTNFDKVWIIVPYDSNGLNKIWSKDGNGEISKSFIDKSFQLRVDVPKPIFSGWENYAFQLIELAIPTWGENDKRQIIDVLHLTRKSLIDIPTPRELKNYINQLAYISSVWGNEFSISSIAYYVIWRELENSNTDTIRINLEKNLLISEDVTVLHKRFLSEKIQQELSGLVFGVNSKRGYELLLLPKIIDTLKNNNQSEFDQILNNNENGFWAIFNEHILTGNISDDDLLKYSLPLYNSKLNQDQRLKNFIDILNKKNIILELINDFFFTISYKFFRAYLHTTKNTSFIEQYPTHFKNIINAYLKDQEINESEWVEDIAPDLKNLIEDIKSYTSSFKLMTVDFNTEQFLEWADYIYKNEYTQVAKTVSISTTCFNELIANLNTINSFSNHYNAFLYLTNYFIANFEWNSFVTSLYGFLSRVINVDCSDIISIFEKILLNDLSNKLDLSVIKDNWPLYNSFYNVDQSSDALICIISGIVLEDSIQTHTISHGHNSANGLKAIQELWKTSDENLALEIIKRLESYNKLYFIWTMTKDDKNDLAFTIVNTASKKNLISGLFARDKFLLMDYLLNFRNKFSDKEMIDILITCLKNNENIHDEFIGFLNFQNSRELYYYIMAQISLRQKINKELINKIKIITKESWIRILEKNDYVLKIIISLREYESSFRLTAQFHDAICDYSDDLIHNNNSDALINKDYWDELIKTLTDSKQRTFKKHITDFTMNNLKNISMNFLELNSNYIDYSIFVNKFDFVFEAIINWALNSEYKILEHFSEINFNSNISNIKKKEIKNYFEENVNNLEEKAKDIILEVLSKINIEIGNDFENDV